MATSIESELTKAVARPAFRLSIGNPRCLVVGCGEPVAFELHDWDYQKTRVAMGFRSHGGRRRAARDPRIYACARHAGHAGLNDVLEGPRWQTLLFAASGAHHVRR